MTGAGTERTSGPDLGAARPSPYRVLARKYRPSTFGDLIGQDAMVRTISNAFETGRIPQAWIFTGVRGVGKTTTARIIARGLNYELPDGSGGPTVTMPVLGVHCQAIMESRHVDILEMDAASHNGVDDIRQINDAVRYAPVSARYKVYILDEVHMLSTQAFNALLKTLEEPPPHVKFIFATTEIRKVPVTVLSRCQRFDLRRVDAGLIVKHLAGICGQERIDADAESLALIARAAEGSVRDSLSLLDQAIAHSSGQVRSEDVRQMLGLADRARVIDLFESLMRGDIAAALKELRDQYDAGADPAVALADLAEFTHFVTRIKAVPALADDAALAEVERRRGREFAAALSMRVLSRTWQMLVKGIPEVQTAVKPISSAEMVLVRIAYAADLPGVDEVIRSLDDATGAAPPSGATVRNTGNGSTVALSSPGSKAPGPIDAPRGTPRATIATQPVLASRRQEPTLRVSETTPAPTAIVFDRFEDLVALAGSKRDLKIKAALEGDVRLVRCENGRLEIALEPNAPSSLVNELSRKLTDWTGQRWLVVISTEPGAPTLRAQQSARQTELETGVQGDPLVQAALRRFPGAQIVGVRKLGEMVGNGLLDTENEPEAFLPDEHSAFGEHGAPDDVDDDF